MNMAIAATRVTGTTVYNGEGDKIGHIEDIMIDKMTGKVIYAVMNFGGFLGVGEQSHPIPWALLEYDEKLQGYICPIAEEKLRDAPQYSRNDIYGGDTSWRDNVFSYYGAAPYWL